MMVSAHRELLAGFILGIGLLCMRQNPVVAAPCATFQIAQYDPNSVEAFEQRIAPALREGHRQVYGDPVDHEVERRRAQAEQARWMPYAILFGLGLLGAILKGGR